MNAQMIDACAAECKTSETWAAFQAYEWFEPQCTNKERMEVQNNNLEIQDK